jgi:hypothetical protein
MAENDIRAGNAAAAAAANPASYNTIRLSDFWCDAPVAWFKSTEALFKLRGVTDDNIKYSLLLTALPRAAFRKIEHLIGNDDDEPAADAYRQLKAALISSHVLSNYQKVEMLAKVEPLGGRRPSDLLNDMLELCPKGEESTSFFCYLFLQRLPREIRVLLADEDPANMRAVADKADKLMVMHSLQAHDMAAVPQQESDSEYEDAVTAVKGGFKKSNKKKKAAHKKTDSQPSKQSTLCFYHASFGDKARNCRDPCSWSEN